jgi:hypothetical protein
MKLIITMEDGLINSVQATEPCEIIVRDVSDQEAIDEPHDPYLLKPEVGEGVISEFDELRKNIEG